MEWMVRTKPHRSVKLRVGHNVVVSPGTPEKPCLLIRDLIDGQMISIPWENLPKLAYILDFLLRHEDNRS